MQLQSLSWSSFLWDYIRKSEFSLTNRKTHSGLRMFRSEPQFREQLRLHWSWKMALNSAPRKLKLKFHFAERNHDIGKGKTLIYNELLSNSNDAILANVKLDRRVRAEHFTSHGFHLVRHWKVTARTRVEVQFRSKRVGLIIGMKKIISNLQTSQRARPEQSSTYA